MQSQTRRLRPAVLLVIVALIAIVAFAIPRTRQWIWQAVSSGTRPMISAGVGLSERLGWSTAIRQESPAEERLRSELAAVSRQLAEARQAAQARETADQLDDYLGRVQVPTVSAAVIGYSPDPGIQSFTINVGRDDNVRVGQAVITGDGWLVGKITTIHATTSVVLLLTDAQSLVLASVQNDSASQGVVRGERGLAVRMDLIPKNDRLTIGQTVVTSGLEAGIPPDLLIGTIAAVEQRSGEVFQRARLTIPIRYGRVRQVAVVAQ